MEAIFPALSLVYFITSLGISTCLLQTQKYTVRRPVITGLVVGSIVAYAGEAILTLLSDAQQDHVVYLLSSAIVFFVEILALLDTEAPVWYPYLGTWIIALLSDGLVIYLRSYSGDKHTRDVFAYLILVARAMRVSCMLALPVSYFVMRNSKGKGDIPDAESQALLDESSVIPDSGYGTTEHSECDSDSDSSSASDSPYIERRRKALEKVKKRLEEGGNWLTYLKGFKIFIPYGKSTT